jgi:hypothetical protein
MPETPVLARAGLASSSASRSPPGRARRRHVRDVPRLLRRARGQVIASGGLRTDLGSPGTDAASLARDFVDVALNEEYAGGALSGAWARGPMKPLLRWEDPVRMQVVFGASVPEARRAEDRRAVRAYAARLSGITGHPVSTGARDAELPRPRRERGRAAQPRTPASRADPRNQPLDGPDDLRMQKTPSLHGRGRTPCRQRAAAMPGRWRFSAPSTPAGSARPAWRRNSRREWASRTTAHGRSVDFH